MNLINGDNCKNKQIRKVGTFFAFNHDRRKKAFNDR